MWKKAKFRYIISMPFIYGIFLPSVFWHICIEIYHQICFRLYEIPLVKSKNYFVYDRQLINCLNWFQKINCYYCSYVNNLVAYSQEIAARTERFWCPIKYIRRIQHGHSQYEKFIKTDDCRLLHVEWDKLRDFSDIKDVKEIY